MTLIEDTKPFTLEINGYQRYGELLKNSVESYPMRDKMVLVMKDQPRLTPNSIQGRYQNQ